MSWPADFSTDLCDQYRGDARRFQGFRLFSVRLVDARCAACHKGVFCPLDGVLTRSKTPISLRKCAVQSNVGCGRGARRCQGATEGHTMSQISIQLSGSRCNQGLNRAWSDRWVDAPNLSLSVNGKSGCTTLSVLTTVGKETILQTATVFSRNIAKCNAK